jgi:hypothetical protein
VNVFDITKERYKRPGERANTPDPGPRERCPTVDNVSLARMRRRGELEHVGKVVPRTDSGILYAQYMEALRTEERKIGRHLLPSELDRFAREYHAPEYGAEISWLMTLGVEETDEDE